MMSQEAPMRPASKSVAAHANYANPSVKSTTATISVIKMILEHTWASSKSPGEGVQFFFSRGGPDFSKQGGPGGSLQKFSLKFHRVIKINKKYTKIGHLLL